MKHILPELFDSKELQTLLDNFYAMTGVTAALLDTQGEVFAASFRPVLCTDFYDSVSNPLVPDQMDGCRMKRTVLHGSDAACGASLNRCPYGLYCCVDPISIRGEKLGALLLGKVFVEQPDMEYYRQEAQRHGFDTDLFLQAVAAVPVVTRDQFDKAEQLLFSLTDIFAGQALARLEVVHNQMDAMHWKQVFEQADLGMSFTDLVSELLVSVNPAYARMHGYAPGELTGKPLLMLYPPELHDQFKSYKRALETTGHLVYETIKVRKDGSRFPARIDLTLVKNDGGRPLSMIGNCVDLTDRQQHAERSILDVRRQQAALRLHAIDSPGSDALLQNAIDEAVRLNDSDVGCIFYFDEESEILSLAAQSQACESAGVAELLQPACKLETAGFWGEAVRQRRPVLLPHENVPLPPPLFRQLSVPVIRNTRVVAVVGVANKATGYTENDQRQLQLFADGVWNMLARYKAEEELKMAMQLTESSLQLKTDLLANLSHELRTPLNGIIGGVQLLGTTELSDEQQEYLEMIEISVNNELMLINNLLELARMDSEDVKLERKTFSLRQLSVESLRIYEHAITSKGLTFSLEFTSEIPDEVIGDVVRIRQILFALIGNALKFTTEGSITVRLAVTDCGKKQMMGCFSVIDTGIGIEPDNLEHIFDLFTQADMSSTRRHGGLGLGLSLSRRLVTSLGGRIWATSTPGSGSTFYCEFPVEPVSVAAETKEQQLTILFVEDEFVSAMISSAMLRKLGHSVQLAVNGKEAVAKWEQQHVDLILMDIQMPVMNGLEALEQIRAHEKKLGRPRTLIIAQTAYNPDNYRESLLASGFDGYIAKPLQFKDLSDLIAGSFFNQKCELPARPEDGTDAVMSDS